MDDSALSRQQLANERYRLADAARKFARERVRKCRRVRVLGNVQAQVRTDGTIALAGLQTCSSVWSCPVCAAKICAGRADELRHAIKTWHGNPGNYTYMMTLTVRHGMGDDLRALRQGIANAMRSMCSGRGRTWRQDLGVVHYCRALEATYGENGWHPHLHVLLFGTRELDHHDRDLMATLWRNAVMRTLGPDYDPEHARACTLTTHYKDTYIVKMGLELTGITKAAKNGNITAWQLLQRATQGDRQAVALRQNFDASMLGARQLTWSRGARDFFRLGDVSDDALASDGPLDVGVHGPLYEWSGSAWDACSRAFPFWLSMVHAAMVSDTPMSALSALPEAARSRASPIVNCADGSKRVVWLRERSVM